MQNIVESLGNMVSYVVNLLDLTSPARYIITAIDIVLVIAIIVYTRNFVNTILPKRAGFCCFCENFVRSMKKQGFFSTNGGRCKPVFSIYTGRRFQNPALRPGKYQPYKGCFHEELPHPFYPSRHDRGQPPAGICGPNRL